MNEDQVSISPVTDLRGAPATEVSLRANDNYKLLLPATVSFDRLPAVAIEWLDYFSFALANHTTVVESLQRRIKQEFPDVKWPNRAAVDGWYELVVGAPLVICNHQSAEKVWHYLADKGWTCDQAGRYHWPEANGALVIGKFIEWFRSDVTLRALPIRFGVELQGGAVSEVVQLCKDWPIAALINTFKQDSTAAGQLRRELKGHRLSVTLHDTVDWISPMVTGPGGVVEKAVASYKNELAPVVMDDPFLPCGVAVAVAQGVYAEGLVAGSPVTDRHPNPYTTNTDL